MEEILFSIIVPTYNRAHLIEATLKSLIDQTYKNFEIIVIDDGSTDNTKDILQNWIGPTLFYHKKANEERAVARNTGTKLAKGQYVNFFDSDDLAYPHHLQTAYEFIKNSNNPEVFHLGYDLKTSDHQVFRIFNYSRPLLNQALIKGNILSCNGVFLRKDIALNHPFREDRVLSASEDYELWLRLAVYYPIHHVNTITSSIINHENRSVLTIQKDKLIARQQAFIKYLFYDPHVANTYKKYKKQFIANTYTYIALHLAIGRQANLEAIKFLFKAFFTQPSVILTKRFWGTFKNLIKL